MSSAISDLGTSEADSIDEPIWAIDESALSSVYSANIGKNWSNSFIATTGTDIDCTTYTNCIVIKSNDGQSANLSWTDNHVDNVIEELTENKLFLYITATTKNIDITLGDTQQKEDVDIVERHIYINHLLSHVSADVESDLYNIMVCISR
jgi:hypothetical protein